MFMAQKNHTMYKPIIKVFLRLALSFSFLSAVADRFGWWPADVSVWGNWQNFLEYTQLINPWLPESYIPTAGVVATAAEIIFGVCLLIGFKTELFAKLSGLLLLVFAFSMVFSIGAKAPFDYSVWSAAAAAFALSVFPEKYWELDILIHKSKPK